MIGNILLDTCAAIWIADDARLSSDAEGELDKSMSLGSPVIISPTIAWEIGILVSRGRYSSKMPVDAWFDALLKMPSTVLGELNAAILIQSSFLPGIPPRDPFDRLFIATARVHGYRLMTRDRKILHYADQGHVQVIPC